MKRSLRTISRGRARGGRLRAALLLALIPGTAGILLSHWPPTESLERSGLDLLFLMRGSTPTPESICIVALDDDSCQEMGLDPAAPWPRGLHARLIRRLAREGA